MGWLYGSHDRLLGYSFLGNGIQAEPLKYSYTQSCHQLTRSSKRFRLYSSAIMHSSPVGISNDRISACGDQLQIETTERYDDVAAITIKSCNI